MLESILKSYDPTALSELFPAKILLASFIKKNKTFNIFAN
jgi:hypothetical protein